MKIHIHCPHCRPAHEQFVVELLPKNDCTYEIECPDGHRFLANILYHEFQKLFEVAINALSDNYYREAIGSFTASYERFMELFIRIAMRTNHVEVETIATGWKKVARQSERQLGAFVFLFLLEFKTQPSLLSEDHIALRNKVVHQGYFPTREECIAYGSSVLSFMRETITLLHDSDKHRGELIRSINDQGDFSPTGPKLHYYAYPLIGTNRPPSNDKKSFDEMLTEALQARKGRIMSDLTGADQTPPTLARLNALLAAGYRIDYSASQKVRDAVWLDHPATKRAREPTLILYPTGLVVSDCAKDPTKEQLRFDPSQELEFGRFLNTVPKPSLWERSSDVRTNAIVLLILLGVVGLIWVVVSALLAMVGLK